MKGLPAETDFVVIGAGVAGLRAAIELAAAGRVLVLVKKEIPSFAAGPRPAESHSAGPNSATPAPLGDEDEVSLHLQDTLSSGDGLCNLAAAKILVDEGIERIEELIGWAAHLDRHGTKLTFGMEGARMHNRILHAQGESLGVEILRALHVKTHSLKHISIAPFTFTTELLCESGRVTGVSLLDEKGVPQDIACAAVVLATGGMGQIYRNTTNPETATGDGVSLALRAGAEISDMEFVQFQPTALYMKKAPRFLLSEALRREGAYLRNIEMSRFLGKYHPMGELAPRDVVARAIMHEMEVSRAKDPFVYLDLTHLNAAKVQKRLPRVYATCMHYNLDITEDLIPVRPAAHFAMGGVRTDLDGRTNVAGLYAAGEAATSGVHGANRLPGNSLLEALVYSARVGKAMREEAKPGSRTPTQPKAAYSNGPVDVGMEEIIGQIQDAMWNDVGIVRTRTGMQRAVKKLEELAPKIVHPKTRRGHEAFNLHLTATQVARSALAREESRGAHYRMDYPDHDDRKFLKHSVVRGDRVQFA
jgi:L-aspartate oxidase